MVKPFSWQSGSEPVNHRQPPALAQEGKEGKESKESKEAKEPKDPKKEDGATARLAALRSFCFFSAASGVPFRWVGLTNRDPWFRGPAFLEKKGSKAEKNIGYPG